jgi:hypothetical protein
MAAPTLAQSKANRNTSDSDSLAVTFDNSVVEDALIVLWVATSEFSYASTVTDNQGNTYNTLQSDGYGNLNGRMYYAIAQSAGSLTITASFTSLRCAMVACEVNGYDSGSPIEKQGKQWGDTGGSAYSPLNFSATTAAEQLFLSNIFLANSDFSANRDFAPGSGWTQELEQVGAGGGFQYNLISKSVTSTGTYDPEYTPDSNIGGFMAALSIVGGSTAVGGGDGEDALSGSAVTGGHGTAAPSISVVL